MAENLGGKRRRKGAAAKDETTGGSGHNLAEIKENGAEIFARLFNLQEEMESRMGEFRSDFKELYEEGANKLGCSRSQLRRTFGRMLANKRAQDAEKDMEAVEMEALDRLRAALGDTPFGQYLDQKFGHA